MNFVWLTARKDLIRLRRDPLALLAWIGIPFFIGLLMSVLFGRGDVKPHGTLLIADEDGSFISRLIPSAFSQEQLGEMFSVEKVSQQDGRRRMGEGKASALIVIPKGFGDSILSGKSSRLVVVKNPSQQILPDIVEQAARLLCDAGFYLHEIAGAELQSFTGSRPTDAVIAATSIGMTRKGEAVYRWLSPPLISLAPPAAPASQPAASPNIAAIMFPGMLMMGILFTASGLSSDWWKEKQSATFRRSLSTPNAPAAILAGKLLAFAALVAGVACIGLFLGRLLLGIPAPNPVWTAAWAVLAACGAYLLFLLLQSAATQRRMGEILVNLLLMPMCMVGGCFFPFEMMPAGLAAFSRLTPLGMAVTVLRRSLEPLASPAAWILPACAAALLIAFLFALCARRLRARFSF